MGDDVESSKPEVAVAPTNPVLAKLDSYFKVTERGSDFTTEFRAGLATFMTLCYILAVNARLLSESGGYCTCSAATKDVPGCVYFDGPYLECIEDFRRQLITITAVSAFVATFAMGVAANLPFALAPGMGLNAYFTYDVVGFHGTGKVKWKTAMAAIFIEGFIFMGLAITGLRVQFAKMIPKSQKLAMTGGIGMFLAHLGLQTAEGIGLVVTDVATGVTLGACNPASRTYALYNAAGSIWPDETSPTGVGGVTADSYTCDSDYGGKMQSATTWLGIITLLLISVLMTRKYRGAIIIGVSFATVISWFKDTDVSYFEDRNYPLGGNVDAGIGGGEYRWDYFKKVAKLEPIEDTWFEFDFDDFSGHTFGVALFTFLYVDLLDTTATLFAMATFAGFTDDKGNFEGMNAAFIVDGAATSFGACIGTSPVTTYIESAPGIEEGGRTGITAIWVSFFFFLSIFFAPILASVPPWATGPALVIVGAMMMQGVVQIDWKNYAHAIPAFITMMVMPLTYSIANGIIGGMMCYVVINGTNFLIEKFMPPKDGAAPLWVMEEM